MLVQTSRWVRWLAGVTAALLSDTALAGGQRLHVRDGAPAAGANGLSWATAFPDLQPALDVARAAPQSVSEIWIAQGVYTPTLPYTGPGQGDPLDPRSRAFLTAGPDIPVYGGFKGDESVLPPISQRRYPTILSGDHLGNDNFSAPAGSANAADNSYHVVRVTNGGCWFNGVTIRGGVANNPANSFDRNGGGLRTTNFNADIVRLEHCRITYNFAQNDGGGLYNNANAYLEACVLDRNRTTVNGGGIRHFGSSLVVVNSVLRQNLAITAPNSGGGAFVTTFSTFTNCTIIDNSSSSGGGGLHAGAGGTLRVANSLLWNNSTAVFGAAVVTDSWVQGVNPDPRLLDTSGPDGAHFTDDDYPFGIVAINSPIRDIGANNADIDQSTGALDALPSTDARGLPRVDGSSALVDIGAYELQSLGEPVYRAPSGGSMAFTSPTSWLGGVAPFGVCSAVFDRPNSVTFASGEVSTRRAVITNEVEFLFDTEAIYWLPGALRFQVLSDDFETDQGWTTQAAGGLTSGQWVRVDPVGTVAQPENNFSAFGTLCYVTGQGLPGGAAGAADVDSGTAMLVSPVMDLSDGMAAEVSYARWFSNSAGAAPGEDIFVVEVSNDAGGSWSVLEIVGPTGPQTSGGWVSQRLRVDHVLPLTDSMVFRFSASDLGQGSLVEAAIDDFYVSRFECDPDDLLGCGAGLVVDRGGSLTMQAADANNVLGIGPAALGMTGGADLTIAAQAGAFFPEFFAAGNPSDPVTVQVHSSGSLTTSLLCSLGYGAQSNTIVSVTDGGRLFASGPGALRVGDQGFARIDIGPAGTVTAGDGGVQIVDVCIGCEAGSDGGIIIDGGQFESSASAFRVGAHGDGTFTIIAGSADIEAPLIEFGAEPGSTGLLDMYDLADFVTTGDVHLGSVSGGAGIAILRPGSAIVAPVVRIAPGSLLQGDGQLTGDVFNGGRAAPRDPDAQSPFGALRISGDYEQFREPQSSSQSSGRLEMEIGALIGQADQLLIDGAATLGGGLYLTAPIGAPAPGSTFSIVEAQSRSGAFDVVSSPIFDDRYFFRVLYHEGGQRGAASPVVEVVLDALEVVAAFDTEQTVNLQSTSGEPLAGATADFNGDGFTDLAVIIPAATPGNPGCVIVLLNAGVDGMGEWLGFQEFASCVTVGLDPRAIVALNVDADNDTDVAVVNFASGSVTVLRNDGDGDFASALPLTLPAPGAPVDIAAADMDLDGELDLVVASAIVDSVLIFHASGVGGFGPAQPFPIGAPPTAMTVDHLVPGGGPDVAVASGPAGAIVVLSNDGARALTGAAYIPVGDGGVPEDIDSGDVDNDKDIDIVAAATQPQPGNPEAGVAVVIIADSAAPNGFRPPAPLAIGDAPRALVLTQLDNAGGPDIAVIAEVDGDGAVQTLVNTTLPGGSASFAEPTTLSTSGSPRFLLSADVDNDEDEDLVTLNGGVDLVLRGAEADVSTLLNELEIALPGDVNFDGVVDFADLNFILSAFNTTGPGSPADLDDDGFIGFADLNFVLSNFNTR